MQTITFQLFILILTVAHFAYFFVAQNGTNAQPIKTVAKVRHFFIRKTFPLVFLLLSRFRQNLFDHSAEVQLDVGEVYLFYVEADEV